MKTCPECNKEYDTEDPSCPECSTPGKPNKLGMVAAAAIGLALAGLIAGGLFWRSLSSAPPEDEAVQVPGAPVDALEGKPNDMDADLGAPAAMKRQSRELERSKSITDEMRFKGNAISLDSAEPDWEERYRIHEKEAAMKYRMPPLEAPITVTMKKGDVLKGVLKEVHNDGIFLKTGAAEISVARSQMHMKSRALLYEDDYRRSYAEGWVAREKAAYAARVAE